MALRIAYTTTPAGGDDPRTTTSASSASYTTAAGTSVSFTFNGSYPVGNYSDVGLGNHLFVVNTDGNWSMTDDTPAVADVGGYEAYGIMKNIYVDETITGAQGLDEMMDVAVTSARCAYNTGLNVAPSRTSNSAITLATNEEATFTKGIRRAAATTSDWQTLEAGDGYVHLHVLNDYPQNGSIPPAPSEQPTVGVAKKQLNVNDVDATVYRTFTLPSSWNGRNYTDDFVNRIPKDNGYFGAGNQDRRRMRIDGFLPNSTVNTGYSAQLSGNYATMCVFTHNVGKLTPEQRTIVEARILYFSLNLWAVWKRMGNNISDASFGGGAGQAGAYHTSLYYGALMSGDADILAAAQQATSAMNGQGKWGTADDYDLDVPMAKDGRNYMPAFDAHVGMPIISGDSVGYNYDGRYVALGAASVFEDTLAIALLNGGLAAMLKGSPSIDPAYAHTWHLGAPAIIRSWSPFFFSSGDPKDGEYGALYDLMASTLGLDQEYRPLDWAVETSDNASVTFDEWASAGAGDGEITWNPSASMDYTTSTITDYDLSYSLDGYQYVIETNVSRTGTKSGLLNAAAHYFRIRQNSALGKGVWSRNYQVYTDQTVRNFISTNGTAVSAVPLISVAPEIMFKIRSAWGQDIEAYEPASESTIAVGDVLGCGVGYYNPANGTPATYAYQWKRDGENISGATSKKYTVVADDAGATLTCDMTPSNASGAGATSTSAGIAVSA